MHLPISTDLDAFSALVWLGAAVGEDGLDSPSLRRIARDRCSPGSLVNWFGSKAGLHRRVTRTLAVKWGRVLTATLVPLTDEDWFYARLRLAYDELARSDAAVAAEVDELARLEREIIAWWLESTHEPTSLDPQAVTVVHALLLRLWDRRVHPDPRSSLRLLEEVINVWIGKPVIERPYVRLAG
jgi:hypothetical protein